MVGLAFGVAAAANFPVLVLSMFWKGLTTRGALFGGYGGLLSAVAFEFNAELADQGPGPISCLRKLG